MTESDASDLPDWAEHRLVLDAADGPEPVTYHVITSGRIEAGDDTPGTETGGVFGHADGTLATSRHEYSFEGRLLSIKVRPSLITLDLRDHREAPFEIGVDGEPIDFERWDPSRGDLPMGYGGPGALPDDVALDAEDCDRIASTHDELRAATDELDDCAVLGIDADVRLPPDPEAALSAPQDDFAIVGLETEDGGLPTVDWTDPPDESRTAVELSGDRSAVLNLQFRGPLEAYSDYEDFPGRYRGLAFAGDDQIAINCDGWHWPHAAFAARGAGETYLCVDAHHNMLGGLGYGFSSVGPIGPKDFDAGETWSDEEMETYRQWHRRTEIKRAVMDANRHDVASGTNGSYEVRYFVTGPTAVTGHRIDMHCPGGGIVVLGDGIVEASTRGLTDEGENGLMIRGWPVVGARVEDTWFTWGEEPDPAHRYPYYHAPIVQVCATPTTRDRRPDWDTSNDPFIRVEWPGSAFGPEEPDWLSEELRRARNTFPDRWGLPGPSGD